MNNPNDPEREDALLRSVLGDEDWQAAGGALKHRAMDAFRARQRMRRFGRWCGGGVALLALIACAVWLGSPARTPRREAGRPPQQNRHAPAVDYVSDEQLLASFPKGSCFIAEIDGRKQLVFLNPQRARTYVADPNSPAEVQ